jgi:hypothetical protein
MKKSSLIAGILFIGVVVVGALTSWFIWGRTPLYELRYRDANEMLTWKIRSESELAHLSQEILMKIELNEHMLAESGDHPALYGYYQSTWDSGIDDPGGDVTSRMTSQSPNYVLFKRRNLYIAEFQSDGQWRELTTGTNLDLIITEVVMHIHTNLTASIYSLNHIKK